MNQDKVFMIVSAQIDPEGQEALKSYIEKSGPLFKNAGGTPVKKYNILDQIVGDNQMSLVSIMEFPSIDSVKGVFESEEYKAIIPLREKAFAKLEVQVGK